MYKSMDALLVYIYLQINIFYETISVVISISLLSFPMLISLMTCWACNPTPRYKTKCYKTEMILFGSNGINISEYLNWY